MHKKNLIVSCLHNYNYPVIEPFLKSLKATGYNGDLVVFTSDTVSKTTKWLLRKKGAIIIEFNSRFPFINGYEKTFEHITPAISLNNYRFLFYLGYLEENAGKYENVMLTDIRDVIFQRNPFTDINHQNIYFFLEDNVQRFNTSDMNYKWSVEANGKEITDTYVNNIVSCAGVTIGCYDLILKYLSHLRNQMQFRKKLTWGFDQGLHNAYIYHFTPEIMNLLDNQTPVVATLGAYQPYNLNKTGQVVTTDGEVYSIVHQYDRFGNLLVSIKKKYLGNRLLQISKKIFYGLMP